VQILVNGQPRHVPSGQTVFGLLAELKLEPRYLAVEKNRVLIPRRQHAACTLEEGDQLEIVTLVGGG
jgi:thiamine biosynthesis protein ThiS